MGVMELAAVANERKKKTLKYIKSLTPLIENKYSIANKKFRNISFFFIYPKCLHGKNKTAIRIR